MDDFDLAGLGAASRGMSGWPEPARRAVGCGGGCALLVLLQFAVIWLVVTLMLNARVPEGMAVEAQLTPRAVVGEKHPLRITVRNQGSQAFTVRAITVRSETLRQFKLEHADPAPRMGKTRVFGTETWAYDQKVAPGKSWTLQLDAVPLKSGKLRGAVEIQAGMGSAASSFTVDATAEGRPEKPAGATTRTPR